jgi:CheY-like chemotaxis protein
VSTAQPQLPSAPETVLLVEDEVLIRVMISAYLRDCGYKVIEATGADEALVILKQSEVPVDIVLTDIEMPGSMDGFALCGWIRKNRPELEVIRAGSPARAATAAGQLCEEGPTLPKPYEPQAVLDRIKRLLAGRIRSK